ncbi:hypothetical protein GN958_ATG00233 [Phytophthora infestans]|uniref:Uncharacterized protein n=1 Tax=Phytophthora infestans TaxID=4787 RepID=A0A8S9VCJ3_PHYIN|nr:hypothetical protein GN958_ATG00233 [Phytophthora infestans]
MEAAQHSSKQMTNIGSSEHVLRPPFREPRDLGTPDPAQHMDDDDHAGTAEDS